MTRISHKNNCFDSGRNCGGNRNGAVSNCSAGSPTPHIALSMTCATCEYPTNTIYVSGNWVEKLVTWFVVARTPASAELPYIFPPVAGWLFAPWCSWVRSDDHVNEKAWGSEAIWLRYCGLSCAEYVDVWARLLPWFDDSSVPESIGDAEAPADSKKRVARENILKNDGMERMNCNSPACEHRAMQGTSKERCAKNMMRRNKQTVWYFVA